MAPTLRRTARLSIAGVGVPALFLLGQPLRAAAEEPRRADVVATTASNVAPAPSGPPVTPPRFGTTDWIVTGAAAATAIAFAFIPPQPRHAYGGVLLDETARDALRLNGAKARSTARTASDVLLGLEVSWPFVIDALVTTWWARESREAAVHMALVDAEALAIVAAMQGVTNTFVSRERPYGRLCGTPQEPGSDCQSNSRYRSFFSGHAALAFTSAGVICTHHVKHRLFGGARDALACTIAYAGAAATGAFRILSDVHYATDVLTGTLTGTLVGIAVPLLHHRIGGAVEPSSPRATAPVDISLVPVGAGLGVGGTF